MRLSASLNFNFSRPLRVRPLHFFVEFGKQGHVGANHFDVEQFRFEAIVQIGGVIGNLIHEIDQLRFQRRPLDRADIPTVREIAPHRNRVNA